MGFTFDDTDTSGVASPISEMHRLIKKSPNNANRIFPFIGGEELNDSPSQMYSRFVINFGDMDEDLCRRSWPDLMRIVEERVRPQRIESARGGGTDRKKRAELWWQFSRTAKDLYDTIRGFSRVVVNSQISHYAAFAFLPSNWVYSHALNVFAIQTYSTYAVIQSRGHEIWARSFGSSMKDDLRYTPSDCFETFPFPQKCEGNPALEQAGREYYEFRAALMVRNNEGLTKTYSRFHDPNEISPDILKLRELHAAMDRAVLDAYGWTDLKPTCEFLLDYEEEDEEDALTPGPSPAAGEGSRLPSPQPWADENKFMISSRFCCAFGEGKFTLTKERRAQVVLAPLVNVLGSTMLHCGSNCRRCRFSQHGSKGDHEAAKPALRLLFLQDLHFSETRFEDFRASWKPFTQPSALRLARDKLHKFLRQSRRTGMAATFAAVFGAAPSPRRDRRLDDSQTRHWCS